MSLQQINADYAVLPDALLDEAKMHMRVEYPRDDALIRNYLAQAIDLFTLLTEFSVAPTRYVWRPDQFHIAPDGRSGFRVPIQPIYDWSAVDGAGHDVLPTYDVVGGVQMPSMTPKYLVPEKAFASGVNPPEIIITLDAGFPAATKLPPSLKAIIVRIASWYYENREIINMPGVDVRPYANQLLTGYWVPRC